MGNFLHKLGELSFNNPWKFIGVWVAVLAILGFNASQFIEPTSTAISIPGTEAQKAIDRADELFSGADGATGRIVFKAKDGLVIENLKPEITELIESMKSVDGVSQVASPYVDQSFISDDGTIAYAQVQLSEPSGSVAESTTEEIMQKIEQSRSSELQIEAGGDLINKVPGELLGIGEVVGVLIALLVLLMTLGSLIAAGMPIITALVGIGVSMAALFSMSRLFEISATTPVLAVMLGLAVGIDYSLFIINKYRTYLLGGLGFKEAAARAVGTAGNAVVFAAMTVVIALAALSVVQIPFMTTMGLVGAGSIAVAALVAITLVPALLSIAGAKIFNKKARTKILKLQSKSHGKSGSVSHKSIWYKWGELITKRPVVTLTSALIVVIAIAIPAKSLDLGLPTDQYAAESSTQHKAYNLLSKGFGAGFNGPLTVVVEGLPEVSDAERKVVRQQAITEYEQRVAEATAEQQAIYQQRAAEATTPEQYLALQQEMAEAQSQAETQKQAGLQQVEQTVEEYAKLVQLSTMADKIGQLDSVAQTLPATATNDGTAGIIQIIPKSAPSAPETTALIETLRDEDKQQSITGSDEISLAVTGATALQEDINAKLANALPVYLAVVVGLSLILLIVAFRSIPVPIKATLGFLLSVLAMFGALVAVFQWGWFGIAEAPGPIVSFIPIIAIGILFGLAMDYEFFLVSGMHEAFSHKNDAKRAVLEGFGSGSKVVTAAGVIMVSVFAGFIFNHDSTIQAIGFGLAVGILVDAFIVRMTIVPAVMTLLGEKAWWLPKWLDKRLPHISIEGEE